MKKVLGKVPRWLRWLMALGAIYGVVAVLVTVVQREMIYFPARHSTRLALALGDREGLKPWVDAAGERIGWRLAPRSLPAQGKALILHGNAGWASLRAGMAKALAASASLEVFILEYPGYSDRAGSPSERAFYQASEEAMQLLGTNMPVILVGESLGTGVAAYLAGRHAAGVQGVLLFAPYPNLTVVAQSHMPLLPVRWLLQDRFPSEEHLRGYHGPLAVVLAEHDTVVPNRFGRKLHDGYEGPKKLWQVEGGHNDVGARPSEWWEEVMKFFSDKNPGDRLTRTAQRP